MTKFNLSYSARAFLARNLEGYLGKWNLGKDEMDLINNLLERLYYEPNYKITFSDAELQLLIDSIKFGLDESTPM